VRAVLAAFEPVDDPRARLDEARARVAALADPDGICRTDAAIEAVWDEAEALAALRQAGGASEAAGGEAETDRGNAPRLNRNNFSDGGACDLPGP
jgi:hypothetical protein